MMMVFSRFLGGEMYIKLEAQTWQLSGTSAAQVGAPNQIFSIIVIFGILTN